MGLKQGYASNLYCSSKIAGKQCKYNWGKYILSANEEQELYSDECYLPAQDVCFLQQQHICSLDMQKHLPGGGRIQT